MLLNEFQYSARFFLFATFRKNCYGSRMSKRRNKINEILLSCDDFFFCFIDIIYDVFSHFEMFEFIFALICVLITFLRNIFIESLTMRIITKQNSRFFISLLFLLCFFMCIKTVGNSGEKSHLLSCIHTYILHAQAHRPKIKAIISCENEWKKFVNLSRKRR